MPSAPLTSQLWWAVPNVSLVRSWWVPLQPPAWLPQNFFWNPRESKCRATWSHRKINGPEAFLPKGIWWINAQPPIIWLDSPWVLREALRNYALVTHNSKQSWTHPWVPVSPPYSLTSASWDHLSNPQSQSCIFFWHWKKKSLEKGASEFPEVRQKTHLPSSQSC